MANPAINHAQFYRKWLSKLQTTPYGRFASLGFPQLQHFSHRINSQHFFYGLHGLLSGLSPIGTLDDPLWQVFEQKKRKKLRKKDQSGLWKWGKIAPNPKFHTDDHHICPVNEHSSFGVSFIFLAMTCESFWMNRLTWSFQQGWCPMVARKALCCLSLICYCFSSSRGQFLSTFFLFENPFWLGQSPSHQPQNSSI